MATLISETDLAVATIIGEAESEGFEGQLAVATVLRNRMRAKFSSDGTLSGTVLAPYQFSVWNTTCGVPAGYPGAKRRADICNLDWSGTLAQQCRTAWLQSKDSPTKGLEDAVMYHASNMHPFPGWADSGEFAKVAQIKNHIFYKRAK